jgi:hypothetical protein
MQLPRTKVQKKTHQGLLIGCALALSVFSIAHSATAQDRPRLPETDRVRLAEAFRLGEAVGKSVWKNWDSAPLAVLLITREHEFLIRHPRPTKDFTLVGYDSLLKSEVYFRKRTHAIDLLATFPAVGGVSTIVVGQAENTHKKTSTPWVVTVLHEHFHQLQSSQPNYYADVNGLNLARGDQSGMWMLNFAFPYNDARVKEQYSVLSKLLLESLRARTKADLRKKVRAYLEARRVFQNSLSADDYKYFSFQLWQEGVARYTEYRVADLAGRRYRPSREFRKLKDYQPFKAVAREIMNGILKELFPPRLSEYQRVAFYSFGATEALLLDRFNPRWSSHYFADKFYLDRYFRAE